MLYIQVTSASIEVYRSCSREEVPKAVSTQGRLQSCRAPTRSAKTLAPLTVESCFCGFRPAGFANGFFVDYHRSMSPVARCVRGFGVTSRGVHKDRHGF